MNAPAPALTKSSLLTRFAVIGLIVGGIATLFLAAAGWLTPHDLSPARIVDGFEQVDGTHPGFRRNHAKGVCVRGHFESSGLGAAYSRASVFQTGSVPVIGRFSIAGGNPYAADSAQSVRALAILFQLPHGQEWRIATINLPVFPFQTPQAFYEQLMASAPDPATGKPDPTRIKTFFEQHPASAAAIKIIGSQAKFTAFENSTFYGLNAFRFLNAAGAAVPVRWTLTPGQTLETVKPTDSKSSDTNFLFDALIAAIHHHSLAWHLVVMLAQSGDATDDATVPWPESRQKVDVGTLIIDQVESDDTSPARDINFDPTVLPDGIAVSDDPLLSARSAVYSKSFTRREGEPKEPSAISPAATGKAP